MSKSIDANLVKSIIEYQKAKKALETIAILRIDKNPTILFVRQFNAEKQALVEITFDERNVPNPQALRGYIS